RFAAGQRGRGGVVRRGAVQQPCMRLHLGQELLHGVPLGRCAVLEERLLLDHPDHAVPRRPHQRQVRGLLGVDQGLDRDQGLMTAIETEVSRVVVTDGPARRFSSWLHRHPRARLTALLSAPLFWLVVAYLGALAALLVTSFWTVDDFTGQLVKQPTLANFK